MVQISFVSLLAVMVVAVNAAPAPAPAPQDLVSGLLGGLGLGGLLGGGSSGGHHCSTCQGNTPAPAPGTGTGTPGVPSVPTTPSAPTTPPTEGPSTPPVGSVPVPGNPAACQVCCPDYGINLLGIDLSGLLSFNCLGGNACNAYTGTTTHECTANGLGLLDCIYL